MSHPLSEGCKPGEQPAALSAEGELCAGLCVLSLGTSQPAPWDPQLIDDSGSIRTWVSAQMQVETPLSLPCPFHRPQKGQTPLPSLSSSLPIHSAPAKQVLNNSWPVYTAQAWSGFLVAKLEREWRPGQLDLGGGFESH